MGILGKWFGNKEAPARAISETPSAVLPLDELLEELRAQGVTGELRVEGNYLFIDEGDGAVRHIFLGNLAAEHAAAAPADRRALLAKYARLGARPPRVAASDLRTRVLPKLVPRRERERMRLSLGGVEMVNLLAGRPLVGDELVLDLAVDEPETIRTVTASDLAGCKLSEDEAYVRAAANLQARSTGRWIELGSAKLFHSPWRDCWDGARLALPALFRSLPLRGDPIVAIPNRSAVLVTGSEEPQGLRAFSEAARLLAEKDRPVHVAPLRLDGERWRELDQQADLDVVRLAPSLLFLSSVQAALDHQACGAYVRERLAARGFTVAELQLVEDEAIPSMTVASFPAGDRVAIPKADMIAFDAGGTSALVAWYKVEAMLGDELVPLDVWPAFYEVRRRPTADELDRYRVRPKT